VVLIPLGSYRMVEDINSISSGVSGLSSNGRKTSILSLLSIVGTCGILTVYLIGEVWLALMESRLLEVLEALEANKWGGNAP
jgi:hypothetical protein